MKIEHTQAFIEAVIEHTAVLRYQLELLLENSSDETSEKEAIADALTNLSLLFAENSYPDSQKSCGYCLEKVAGLTAFGDSDSEEALLRFCLLLEQVIEEFELGVSINDRLFSKFINNLSDEFGDESQKNDDKVNLNLLKMLRTVYQKQLLQLIKNPDKGSALNALVAVCQDFSEGLPKNIAKEWDVLEYYLNSLNKKTKSTIEVETHRLLAMMDLRLAKLLQSEDLEETLFSGLIAAVEKTPLGSDWLKEHIILDTEFYISAGVYSRFSDAIKDPLVKLHESFERVYLDPTQNALLSDSVPFLSQLYFVLQLMGLQNMAALTQKTKEDIIQLSRTQTAIFPEDFNKVVSTYWVFESCFHRLWNVNDSALPLNYEAIQKWALVKAKQSAFGVFASAYKALRESIDQSSGNDLASLKSQLFEIIAAEKILGTPHALLASFPSNFTERKLTQAELSEIVLTLEYCASKNFEGGEISTAIIEQACQLITEPSAMQQPTKVEKPFSVEEPVNIEELPEEGLEYRGEGLSEEIITNKRISTDKVFAVEGDDGVNFITTIDHDLLEALINETTELERDVKTYMPKVNPIGMGIVTISSEAVEHLKRVAHTLRGNANIVAHIRVANFAKKIEETLSLTTYYDNDFVIECSRKFKEAFDEFKFFLGEQSNEEKDEDKPRPDHNSPVIAFAAPTRPVSITEKPKYLSKETRDQNSKASALDFNLEESSQKPVSNALVMPAIASSHSKESVLDFGTSSPETSEIAIAPSKIAPNLASDTDSNHEEIGELLLDLDAMFAEIETDKDKK